MQAGVPFKAKGTGADETKMDTAAVAMLHEATGDKQETSPVPVYSYSSAPCQQHSLTLALYIYLEFEWHENDKIFEDG